MENDRIRLIPMTPEMYHTFFKEYMNDPDLYPDSASYVPFTYNKEKVDQYIRRQIELNRIPFAIMCEDEIAGEILIKNIEEHNSAAMSITLKNARFKDRGFGTAAEKLAVQFVFFDLDIPVLYADTLKMNTRSQHVLEKAGFKLIKEDKDFKYFQISRDSRHEVI